MLRAIDRERYSVLPIGITAEGRWALTVDAPGRMEITGRRLPAVNELTESDGGTVLLPVDAGGREVVYSEPGSVPKVLGDVDVVFPMLHGPYGEDGTLQGLLELSGVPYVGCGVLSSAIGMDKEYMKRVFTSFGLPTGPYEVVRPREWQTDPERVLARLAGFAGTHGWPLVGKHARAGSSTGLSKVSGPGELAAAIIEARAHDPKVLVESLLRGREIECGVLEFEDGPRACVPAEIPPVASHDFYDFDAKYLDLAEGLVRAPLTGAQTARVQALAPAASDAVACEGLARVDFFLLENGELVINEVNTMPGFTPISMYPRMWQASGIEYPELIDRLIQAALRRPSGLR